MHSKRMATRRVESLKVDRTIRIVFGKCAERFTSQNLANSHFKIPYKLWSQKISQKLLLVNALSIRAVIWVALFALQIYSEEFNALVCDFVAASHLLQYGANDLKTT